MEELYKSQEINLSDLEFKINLGRITEKDKFLAAKQILFGLAVLYVLTILAYLYNPKDAEKLITLTITTFPPLATLILVAYFKDKGH